MKRVSLFASATIVSTLIASAIAAPVFACHPVGVITKTVQDQTAGGVAEDANSDATALSVNSGDTLVYTITVKNTGLSADNGDNDMLHVTLTDTLPTGVQLESDPAQTVMSEQLGTIKPGQSVTRSYTVKITDSKDSDTITNTACYTADSKVSKNSLQGCDDAVVKVNVPTAPTIPAPTTTPAAPQTSAATLPDTGNTAMSVSLLASGTVILGYTLNLLRLKLRGNA